MGKHSRGGPVRLQRHRVKVALLALIVVGELATIGVRGTFALMVSQTQNSSSAAAAGTMTLSTSSGSTTCRSWTGSGTPAANDNPGCGTLLSVGPYYPGQSSRIDVAVTNNGSLPSNLYLDSPPDANGNNCTPSLPGICDAVELTVQETASNYTTPITCFYPESSGTCSFAPFAPPSGGSCPLGSLTDFTVCQYSGGGAMMPLNQIAPGATRYFVLSFGLPTFTTPSTANQYQGETATFSLGWLLDQTYYPGF
ncbi:MAG: hypothetical protein M0004_12550 [Actinomycetota bacterium]|nr:hypothetical protein [Actinomycetota bacterium]